LSYENRFFHGTTLKECVGFEQKHGSLVPKNSNINKEQQTDYPKHLHFPSKVNGKSIKTLFAVYPAIFFKGFSSYSSQE